jgi:hypothetical protein
MGAIGAWTRWCRKSGGANGLGLGAFLTLADLELHSLTLIERTVAIHLDCGPVHEDVGATTINGDEAITLFGVEPLDGSLSHFLLLLAVSLRRGPSTALGPGLTLAVPPPERDGPGWSNVRASGVTLERTLLIELFDHLLP